jgi:hypothetical protein
VTVLRVEVNGFSVEVVRLDDGRFRGVIDRRVAWGWSLVASAVGDLPSVVALLVEQADRFPGAVGVVARVEGWFAGLRVVDVPGF